MCAILFTLILHVGYYFLAGLAVYAHSQAAVSVDIQVIAEGE